MKGLILGGGPRLRPVTCASARQMVPAANTPVLFYGIESLAEASLVDTQETSATGGALNGFLVGTVNPGVVQVHSLVCHRWTGIGAAPAFVDNVRTERYRPGEPDEYRLEPHRTVPNDGTRNDD